MRRELRDAATGVSDWHVPTSQLLATGTSTSSARDLPAQPTTPIHIAQLASVTERPGATTGSRHARGQAVMSAVGPPSALHGAGAGHDEHPLATAAGRPGAGAADRRCGGNLVVDRPALRPGRDAAGQDRAPDPAGRGAAAGGHCSAAGHAPPAAASATTAAPTADDDLPVVLEPRSAPTPTSVTEPRAPEPDRKTRVTKRGRRAGSPQVAAQPSPERPAR